MASWLVTGPSPGPTWTDAATTSGTWTNVTRGSATRSGASGSSTQPSTAMPAPSSCSAASSRLPPTPTAHSFRSRIPRHRPEPADAHRGDSPWANDESVRYREPPCRASRPTDGLRSVRKTGGLLQNLTAALHQTLLAARALEHGTHGLDRHDRFSSNRRSGQSHRPGAHHARAALRSCIPSRVKSIGRPVRGTRCDPHPGGPPHNAP